MSKMKICFFGDGESIHIVRWCKHFAQLGDDVHLITFKNVKIEGVTTHFVDAGSISVGGGNWRVVFQYKKVKALLKQIQPDLFHAHYATSYGITGALCGFHPYVITPFGTDILISAQRSKIYRMLLKYAFSKADWVNTLADHMSATVEKMGVNMKKVDSIPFGIDDEVFNDKNRVEDRSRFVITSTRNHEQVYNIPHLIHALALVKDKIPHLEVKIAGGGSLTESLKTLVNELALDKVVTFTGKIPQPEMVRLLNQTNLFVTVSLSDGNSLSLAEALNCGAVCIATDIPANRQWITHGQNGFLVAIDDVEGLAKLLLDAHTDYENFQKKASDINRRMMTEKGFWRTNMIMVRKKYEALIKAHAK